MKVASWNKRDQLEGKEGSPTEESQLLQKAMSAERGRETVADKEDEHMRQRGRAGLGSWGRWSQLRDDEERKLGRRKGNYEIKCKNRK